MAIMSEVFFIKVKAPHCSVNLNSRVLKSSSLFLFGCLNQEIKP
jgi:hypothetical protein